MVLDWKIRLRRRPKTLLQCLKLLRPLQTAHHPLPLVAQALVPPTAALRRPFRRRLHALPAAARRPQLARHVHPDHGIGNVHPALDAAGRTKGCIPPRTTGIHSERRHCSDVRRSAGHKNRNLPARHNLVLATARPRRLQRLQIRARHRLALALALPLLRRHRRLLAQLGDIRILLQRKRLLPAQIAALRAASRPEPAGQLWRASRRIHGRKGAEE